MVKRQIIDASLINTETEATIRLVVRAKNHKLLSIREFMNYSQAEMAEYLNIDLNTYGRLERLNYSEISRETLKKVSDLLRRDIDDLFPGWASLVGESYNSKDNFFLLDDNYAKSKSFPSEFGESPKLLKESFQTDIEMVMAPLTDKEKFVIKNYYGLCGLVSKNYEEIADELNLSRERVRQLKKRALRRMRHHKHSEILKEYLEVNLGDLEYD